MELQIFQLFFSDSKSRTYFSRLRWQGRRFCPRCGERKLWHIPKGRFRCTKCRYPFDDFTGTYLGRFRIPPNIISHLLYLFALGVPAYRISRYISCNSATIEKVFRTIREAIYDLSVREFLGLRARGELECPELVDLKAEELEKLSLGGKLEIGGTMFAGEPKRERSWGAYEKNIIFGIYHKNGKVVVFPVPDRRKEVLISLLIKGTNHESVYCTDDSYGYVSLVFKGKYYRVRNNEGNLKGADNISAMDGFWSYAKAWLNNYRGVPRKYFHLYLKEIEYRFNNREEDLFTLFAQLIVKSVPNRKVLYDDVHPVKISESLIGSPFRQIGEG